MQFDSQNSNIFKISHINPATIIDHGSGGGNGMVMESHQAATTSQSLPLEADRLKHRRTRIGCYTCRSRRVKVLKVPW